MNVEPRSVKLKKISDFVLIRVHRLSERGQKINFEFWPLQSTLLGHDLEPAVSVIHLGTNAGGHYVTYVHDRESGWSCDDEKVTHGAASQLYKCNTYALLYKVENPAKATESTIVDTRRNTHKCDTINSEGIPVREAPQGTFWVRDGNTFVEMKRERNTIKSTGRQCATHSGTYYIRQFLGHTTRWLVVTRNQSPPPKSVADVAKATELVGNVVSGVTLGIQTAPTTVDSETQTSFASGLAELSSISTCHPDSGGPTIAVTRSCGHVHEN